MMNDCISREDAYNGPGRLRVIATVPSIAGAQAGAKTWRGILKAYDIQRDVVTIAPFGVEYEGLTLASPKWSDDVEVGRGYVRTSQ